jgi:hypothetical protein
MKPVPSNQRIACTAISAQQRPALYSLRKNPLNEGYGVTGYGKAHALYQGTALAGP